MASPEFYSEGSTPRKGDTQLRVVQKLLGATLDGGIGGVAGVGPITSGHGDPSGDPGVGSALYYDLDTGTTWQWNDETETWV